MTNWTYQKVMARIEPCQHHRTVVDTTGTIVWTPNGPVDDRVDHLRCMDCGEELVSVDWDTVQIEEAELPF